MASYGQVFRGHIKIEIEKALILRQKTTVKIENDLRNSLVPLSGHSKEKNCEN
jgi:hypothetical protein